METKLFLYAYCISPNTRFKWGDLKIIEMHWNLISAPSKKTPTQNRTRNEKEQEQHIISKLIW